MTKNQVSQAVARRLGCTTARIEKLLDELHASGLIKPIKGSRRYPPDASDMDAGAIVLAVLSDRGLERAAEATKELAALTGEYGRFDLWLVNVLFGVPRHMQHLIVGHEGVSVVVDGQHITFGTPPETAAKIVPGSALMALAAELQGLRPDQADAVAAISSIRGL